EIVLDALEIIARHRVEVDDAHAVRLLELGKARKRRRLALAEIGEDEAEIFLDRIGRDADLGGEGRALGRLLHALPGAVVQPAVIEAAQAIALDRAERQRRLAVRAAVGEEMRRAALAAIEGEEL